MSTPQPQQISINELDLSQLADVRQQLEQELNHLSNSFAQLRQAQAKFKACIDSTAEIKPQNLDKTILVPLTNSLYVPGKLCDAEHVVVDVGTGYFVRKSRAQATKYYTDKVAFIQSNLEALEETIQKKRDNLSYILNTMQSKIQAEAQPVKKS
ncbi:Prefoldin alpha subunit [Fistulina hepatica ATCC 64428]|uniref:Prefoldin alpha subunit n=1 Tax=Fistulina hepatica ATCC 64428 TaxID=1128425 RepID=A0A0D7AQ33_9AGAR|nr:Prefoldin alpha subunit [Fistulina hepatica ATCC 64428]